MYGLRVKFLFIFIAVLSASAEGKEFYEGPFFWSKPEIQEKMKKERYLPVSVTSDHDENNQEYWSMKGAGITNAPCDFAFEWSQRFEEIKKLKDHFPEVSWNADKTELNLSLKVLSRVQKIKFKLWRKIFEANGEQIRRLHYLVLDGPYKGSEGAMILTNAKQQRCEIGLVSVYKGKLFMFGSSVIAVAVEGVIQHVAKTLRSGVENAWIQYRN